ncbi:MAG: zeta toxin family protein [Ruminococcus sp.]|nr:zeta toxin family protein [Ruminococcus sp.]
MTGFNLGLEKCRAREFAEAAFGVYVRNCIKNNIDVFDNTTHIGRNAYELWHINDLIYKCRTNEDIQKIKERISFLESALPLSLSEGKNSFAPDEESIYQGIKEILTEGKHSVDKPVAIVLGGQPGAGKSNLYDIAKKRFDGNIVEIDCDRFRVTHPDSDKLSEDIYMFGINTNKFVSAISDRLIEELSECRYNMIIESPMKSSGTAFWCHDVVTPKGYDVEAWIIATSKEISWEDTINRFLYQFRIGKQARIVPPDYHDNVVENIADAAQEIFASGKVSNMQILTRKGDCKYCMKDDRMKGPKDILNALIQVSYGSQRTFIDLLNKDEIKKLMDAKIKFNVIETKNEINIDRYENRFAVRFNFDLVERVYALLERPFPCDISYLKQV